MALDSRGDVAAFCLVWLDEENGVGELEPVGTHADHRRRGLGYAVCLAAMDALGDRADTAVVYYVGTDPAASSFYRALGFEPRVRHVRFAR